MKILNLKLKTRGFTLLEMLVVIGIIAVLVTLSIASYSTAQRKSRDARRRSDLASIRNAFEQYYSICDYKYPAVIPAAGAKLTALPADCTSIAASVDLITMPADPLGGSYQCGGTCDTSGFLLCPKDLGGGKYMETSDCNSSNQNCCVANQQ